MKEDSIKPIANLLGTEGSDLLDGDRTANEMKGGLGDDTLKGNRGADSLFGELGMDLLYGEQGNDVMDGGEDDDKLYGGVGDDTLMGGLGNDGLEGGVGKDLLYGNDGDDTLMGGQGKDKLYGGVGNDLLYGGQGNDMLIGSDAAVMPTDGSVAPDQVDILTGGNGKDTFVLGMAGAQSFYSVVGDADYAVIADLKQPDRIQLAGVATDYTIGVSAMAEHPGAAIFKNGAAGQAPELIAVLQGVDPASLSLASQKFTFV